MILNIFSRYQLDKPTVLGAFNALLEEFQDEAALERRLVVKYVCISGV